MPQNLIQKIYLPFESPIEEIDKQIIELNLLGSEKGVDCQKELKNLQQKRIRKLKEIYSNLTPWETTQVTRHSERPGFQDFRALENRLIFDFEELHGDRLFGDDRAIITGLGKIGGQKVMIIGQEKGKTTKEKIACNFGMPHPEGYRKALRMMKIAEKFYLNGNLDAVVSFIDTPGAYPGIEAEERGQAQAIAVNLMELSRLRIPMISIIIGQGGSGGAEGIKGQDNVAVLEHAYYSVISPEGCAGILGKGEWSAEQAANALKLTSKYGQEFGMIDTIILEPLGGAHQYAPDYTAVSRNIQQHIIKTLIELKKIPLDQLLEQRYQKVRNIGYSRESATARLNKIRDRK